jgi:hypothetical protein
MLALCAVKMVFSKAKISGLCLRLLLFLSLLLVICGISIEFSASFEAVNLPQQYAERTEGQAARSARGGVDPRREPLSRLAGIDFLMLPNYPEDRAVREALLAGAAQWEVDRQKGYPVYRASNSLTVYLDTSLDSDSQRKEQARTSTQPDGTLLTARILLGLWASRRADLSPGTSAGVMIHPDEILAWRGVQKHHRLAYPGARKQFSDGYPWKQKQQIQRDLDLLSRYHVRGQHTIMVQGKLRTEPIDSPYLDLTPVEKQGKFAGYLVAPGPWLATYDAHDMHFFSEVERQLFQLHPRNDYLALRLGFYLTEHWRRHQRGGQERTVFYMANLLAASQIPVEKANLTSRFVPRVEAALHKLHTLGVLGEPPLNVTPIDKSRAYWGKDWLSSSWLLVPARL